ncbi:hypothetical protein [uncultured Shewanella sp.]|uniref:hypothetical protein n=1 Tax=uncultured Shewanella sp. TaxID=173975 RepID=UPI0026275D47|nr:hypothetical protein [uncultured Shewanella sp.]
MPNGDIWPSCQQRVSKIKQAKQSDKQAAATQVSTKASQIHYLWDGDSLIEQQRYLIRHQPVDL